MGISPTDLSNSFVKSGRRLITQLSSDALLNKSTEKKAECTVDLWDPTTGPQEPSEDCANLESDTKG